MDINDLYSQRIQQTFDDDHAEIVSILHASPRSVLKLINYYKGLPLSYPANIASFDRGTVGLEVKAEQAFVIEKCRSTFIRSTIFKHDVFAPVQYVSIKKQAAFFVKFSYIEIMAERRNFVRIETDPIADAVISSQTGRLDGKLYDISISGLCILIDHYFPIDFDAEVLIKITLKDYDHNEDFSIRIPAKLIGIKGNSAPYSYKFSINIDRTLERQISKYIFQRQLEVMREIKDAAC
jgi:hypothetical protein